MQDQANPFHAGELKAQALTGKTDVPTWAAGFIRPFMPDQHRVFFSQMPFVVLSGGDALGRHWVTMLDGPDGFIGSPEPTRLTLDTALDRHDPLADAFLAGTDIGLLGIELATRRRNRLSGTLKQSGAGFVIDVRQSFGNCPQYIHERSWKRAAVNPQPASSHSQTLSQQQIERIQAADTLFIGTGHRSDAEHASNGYDASHRGGPPGFVSVQDPTHLRIPDYAGNNFFNTIGNLLENPAIGLLFVDFDTGGLLHVSGRATVDWAAHDSHDPNALRMIDVTIDAIVDRPAALSLRWSKDETDVKELVVVDKVPETEDITSFYLSGADGHALEAFEAGQHLPIALDIPGQSALVQRSYSLSGAPDNGIYRLSVKREDRGLVSRFMHDHVEVGSTVRTRKPSGDFVIPCSNCPLVLVSAGVGLTPMVSMLHAAISATPDRPVRFVHGTRNAKTYALKSEVDALIAQHPSARAHVFYSKPDNTDLPASNGYEAGRITAQRLLELNVGADAQYMLCGPAQFLADLRSGLEAQGVPAANIHFETFGPTG